MQAPTQHPLIEVTLEEMERVRKHLNLDRAKISKDLDIIEEWVKKEEHLAKAAEYLDLNYIERLYIIEKGSVERTKSRIDRLLTTRGMIAEISLNKSIDEFDEFSQNVIYVPLPKLNPSDLSRVTVVQLINEKGNNTKFLHYLRYVFLIVDYCMKIDYTLGERYIIDLNQVNMTGISQINPFVLKKGEVLCTEGYGFRIKGVHIINAPYFVDKLVMILKSTVKEKISKRIHVHNTFEDLQKEISKEVLPEEYDGDLENCSVLYDKWKKTLKSEESRNVIDNANKLAAEESKRSSYSFNAEYLGMPGSFSQLVVD
ncbi:alpha-tocopherol transfer protein-like [Bicyclus anynana]|uniref:Alpha-tocopherol transfer protein-like n=1 Tax=Bicyclus anynana TaxID=110368 RepID=A0A6J1NKC0_BICAN|nr:alpha-tocopherol transfer protein-like [Bicyclus anynana]